MEFPEQLGAYSQKKDGALENYLKERFENSIDNLFFGPEHFFILKDRNFLIPNLSTLRVNKSPLPDLSYFVNSDFLLESNGPGKYNMNLIGAEKGIYDPNEVLREMLWSISDLNPELLFPDDLR